MKTIQNMPEEFAAFCFVLAFFSWVLVNSKWNIVSIIRTANIPTIPILSDKSYNISILLLSFMPFPNPTGIRIPVIFGFALEFSSGFLCIWNYFYITELNIGLVSLWIALTTMY